MELHQQPITEPETIKHLELSAVQAAQMKLVEEEAQDYSYYYCVGYSVLYYNIDGEQIGSLVDQSGDTASVEIIATFLPKIVVESLLAALDRAGLEMEALTLEPIAAIDVLIPESMRRLNVALVDIGAGTSDIAITNKGTVAAYGMVPVAGDEITETISDHYLLDFPIAEETKRKIVTENKAEMEDILGFRTTITYDDLAKAASDAVNNLAKAIANEILQLNHKFPMAVMLIGGGSLTPEITKVLANKMQLPENRVAVRSIDAIKNLSNTDKLPNGPDYVTPIGIAIAAKQNPVHYVNVRVNGKRIRLFEMKELTAGDCLIQAGIDINKMYGKPGMASIVTVNSKSITLPGELGDAPAILLNKQKATVDQKIQHGDEIIITKGSEGKPPKVSLEELIGYIPPLTISYNEEPLPLHARCYVNEKEEIMDYIVQDKDKIVIKQIKSVHDFLTYATTEQLENGKAYPVFVNRKVVYLDAGKTQVFVNEAEVNENYKLKPHDRLDISPATFPTVADLLQQLDKTFFKQIKVTFQGEAVTLYEEQLKLSRNGQVVDPAAVLEQNDKITIEQKESNGFIFQDIFRYVDIDLSYKNGKFSLMKNNVPTSFDSVIEDGDQLEIVWE
jgi:cell division ATPase FtsA